MTADDRHEHAHRMQQLRDLGMTWEQIAGAWQMDHPGDGPRVAFRRVHTWTQSEVADAWNVLASGEPTVARPQIWRFEKWPDDGGRRPSIYALSMLARLYQTTGRRLLTPDEYARYSATAREQIDAIDHRALDEYQPLRNPPGRPETTGSQRPGTSAATRNTIAAATTLEEILDTQDELMRRRDLFALTGGLAATALIPELPLAPSSPSFTPDLYDTCVQLTATHRRLDNLLGPYAVVGQVMDHHQRLTAWLRQAASEAERQRIAALAIDSGGLASWLCLDLDHHEQALWLARQSLTIAAENNHDVSRQAYLVGRMSRILAESENYGDALQLADGAVRLAGTHASPTVRSWLVVIRAYIHAGLGDERSCRVDLETATTLLDHASGAGAPDDYIAFHSRAHLHKMAGLSLLRLGTRATTAISDGRLAIDMAHAMWSDRAVRASAEVLTARASARLAQGEIPEAARLTGQAYAIAKTTRSPRNLRHVQDLRIQFRPYRDIEAVRELADQFGL